ncbi:hypothetical protein [Roseovarius ramblicola]|uniref:Uncharacterized protein n=1 Tax=Roseovarius ramblicola TaxID=2022336 RepID=A0ABV5HY79_9RHOB
MEWTGGGLASTSSGLARRGHALFAGKAIKAPHPDRLLDGVPVSPAMPDTLCGAGVASYARTPPGPVCGHGGWIPAYVSNVTASPIDIIASIRALATPIAPSWSQVSRLCDEIDERARAFPSRRPEGSVPAGNAAPWISGATCRPA